MTIGFVQINLLKLTGGGKDDISKAGGIGLKEIVNHSEEIITQQTFDDPSGIGSRGHGIGIVDIKRMHRRIGLTSEYGAQTIHIQCTGSWRANLLMLMSHDSFIPAQPIAGTIH